MARIIVDNLYLLLELDYDTQVSDLPSINKQIDDRIEEKRKLWSSKIGESSGGAKYALWVEGISEIKEVMNNALYRKKEALEAKKLIAEQIDKYVNMFIVGDEIEDEKARKIASILKIADSKVFDRLRERNIKRIETEKSSLVLSVFQGEELYKKYYKQRPSSSGVHTPHEQSLALLGKEDYYDFLNTEGIKNFSNTPDSQLVDRANSLKKYYFGKSDAKSTAGTRLCSICELTFKSASAKEGYLEYLNWKHRREFFKELKKIAEIADNRLSLVQLDVMSAELSKIINDGELAKKVVEAFCTMEHIVIELLQKKNSSANKKVCKCGFVNNIEDGRTICQKCGEQLFAVCPICGEVNDATVNICKCGYSYENFNKSNLVCVVAEQRMYALDFENAERQLIAAKKLYPDNAKIVLLEGQLSALREKVGKDIKALRIALSGKRYLEAREIYRQLKETYPDYIDKSIEKEIEQSISEANKWFVKAKTCSVDAEIQRYSELVINCCSDFIGIDEIMDINPPKAPTNLNVFANGSNRNNRITFVNSQSTGEIYYNIIRKRDSVPENVQDGERLARTTENEFFDNSLSGGVVYFYAIFAERKGRYSSPLFTSKGIANFFEIRGISVSQADKSIQLEWESVPSGATVEIFRVNEKEELLARTDENAFIDSSVENGKEYTYRLSLSYLVYGERISTKGVQVKTKANNPIVPVELLSLSKLNENGDYELRWDSPDEVILYVSEKDLGNIKGAVWKKARIDKNFTLLDCNYISNSKALFTLSSQSLVYIYAVTIDGDNYIIGDYVRVSRAIQVDILSVKPVYNKLYISLSAVKDVVGFEVNYRHDRFNGGYQKPSPETTTLTISKKLYELNNAIVIENLQEKDYYFEIYALFNDGNEKIYSSQKEFFYSNKPKEKIYYSIKQSKGANNSLISAFKFWSDKKQFDLPDIEIYCAQGGVPIIIKNAELVGEIKKHRVEGHFEKHVIFNRLTKINTYVKAFLTGDSSQKYELVCNIDSQYKVK